MNGKKNPLFTAPLTDEEVYGLLDMLYDLITIIENERFSQLRCYHNKLHKNEPINND